jgi:hypothetical protein
MTKVPALSIDDAVLNVRGLRGGGAGQEVLWAHTLPLEKGGY